MRPNTMLEYFSTKVKFLISVHTCYPIWAYLDICCCRLLKMAETPFLLNCQLVVSLRRQQGNACTLPVPVTKHIRNRNEIVEVDRISVSDLYSAPNMVNL